VKVFLAEKEVAPMELLDLQCACLFEARAGHIQVEKLPDDKE
jgi:hypothetical protein